MRGEITRFAVLLSQRAAGGEKNTVNVRRAPGGDACLPAAHGIFSTVAATLATVSTSYSTDHCPDLAVPFLSLAGINERDTFVDETYRLDSRFPTRSRF